MSLVLKPLLNVTAEETQQFKAKTSNQWRNTQKLKKKHRTS